MPCYTMLINMTVNKMNETVIKQNNSKLIMFFLIGALLTALFLILIIIIINDNITAGGRFSFKDDSARIVFLVIFIIATLMFGFLAICSFYRLLRPSDVLVINEKGFTYNSSLHSKSFIPWEYVDDIHIIKYNRNKYIAVKTNGNFTGAEINISLGITDAKYEDVLELMQNSLSEYRSQAGIDTPCQDYPSEEEDNLSTPQVDGKKKMPFFFSLFKPTAGYFITPVLINTNILIFIAMIISGVNFLAPEIQSLLDWGANFRPLTLSGQWWRLFTAIFLHIGVAHILLNMYALIYIGFLLEPLLGKARFLAAYLISGIAASVVSLWWHDFSVGAGASGAIFGMYGVFLALLTTNLLDKSIKGAFFVSIVIFVGYSILNGLITDNRVDNAAHIGGLISGLLIGYAFVPSLKSKNSKLILLTTGILSIVLLVSSFAVCKSLPNDLGKYIEKRKEFSVMESKALEFFSLPRETPKATVLYELKNNGIFYWNENLKLVESMDELNLPPHIMEDNAKLKEYCELRIKCYELYYKSILEDTYKYQVEIDEYNKQIEKLLSGDN